MSKSLKRVIATLAEGGSPATPLEMPDDTRTAAQAAATAGCTIDQIAKSIIFCGEHSGAAILFITAGGNQVDQSRASELVQEPLTRADAALVRAQTGFAIGGVSPIGHLTPIRSFFDPRLLDFDVIWAAAGTPRHIFSIDPKRLITLSGATVADFCEGKET